MKGLFLSQVSGTTGLILLEAKQLAWDASIYFRIWEADLEMSPINWYYISLFSNGNRSIWIMTIH